MGDIGFHKIFCPIGWQCSFDDLVNDFHKISIFIVVTKIKWKLFAKVNFVLSMIFTILLFISVTEIKWYLCATAKFNRFLTFTKFQF